MGFESPSHWVILLILAALLFGGYKKLPEMSRSVGRSLRIFKTEMKGMSEDDAARVAADQAKVTPAETAPVEAAPAVQQVPVVPVVPVVPQAPPVGVPVPPAASAPVVPASTTPAAPTTPAAVTPDLTKTPSENS